ncbi:VOC family protein [Phytohabitans aurantiacus]|uniref:Glyoxalase-like domain-containing protein n=1 Tax=Phytohabitans aurantiacus TaxID=3016789 RepID=A0ABQ5R0G8_9ACTN|nr:VOC family protein [Phytohabitans aurantiacus]GLH99351.1 hypothetical protein Pa4123_46260 [Phytohabitans aurantiacus]
MSTIANLTIHCHNAELLSSFWAQALGWDRKVGADGSASLTDPSAPNTIWYLENVADLEPATGRWHVDLKAQGRPEAEIDRLLNAGATQVNQFPGWTVLADPEGNRFCVLH